MDGFAGYDVDGVDELTNFMYISDQVPVSSLEDHQFSGYMTRALSKGTFDKKNPET